MSAEFSGRAGGALISADCRATTSKRIAILASMEADVQERLDAARGKSKKSKPADKPKDEKPSMPGWPLR